MKLEWKIVSVALVAVLVVFGIVYFSMQQADDQVVNSNEQQSEITEDVNSEYLGSYTLVDEDYGTMVTVVVEDGERTITSNSLPNHETGEFPNSGNPNSISEQDNTYVYPTNPVFTGEAVWAREPGVGINGIKFEPETAEVVSCTSGEQYKLEAFQDLADLGFDFNNAHVQPDGTYHYHGVPSGLVDSLNSTNDIVHVGFAADGHLIYYSKSGAYEPSYSLKIDSRTGTGCTYNVPGSGSTSIKVDVRPDGSYVSDWEYEAGKGQLDECNGAILNGTYAYFLTDSYPYVSRCLMGEFEEAAPSGTAPGGGQPPVNSGPPPR